MPHPRPRHLCSESRCHFRIRNFFIHIPCQPLHNLDAGRMLTSAVTSNNLLVMTVKKTTFSVTLIGIYRAYTIDNYYEAPEWHRALTLIL